LGYSAIYLLSAHHLSTCLVFSSLSITSRPPTYTLFPYTTLFRSKSVVEELQTEEFPRIRVGIGKPMFKEMMIGYVLQKLQGEERDRKSTRLNSSHVSISYAVFCLKKKNNKINKKE